MTLSCQWRLPGPTPARRTKARLPRGPDSESDSEWPGGGPVTVRRGQTPGAGPSSGPCQLARKGDRNPTRGPRRSHRPIIEANRDPGRPASRPGFDGRVRALWQPAAVAGASCLRGADLPLPPQLRCQWRLPLCRRGIWTQLERPGSLQGPVAPRLLCDFFMGCLTCIRVAD